MMKQATIRRVCLISLMNNLGLLGIVLFGIVYVIDKMIYALPNFIYIPLAILTFMLIIIGFIKDKKGS